MVAEIEKTNYSGLTLAELMVAVTITAMMIVGIATFFGKGIDFFRVMEAKVSIQRDARHCLSLMNRYLRQARTTTVQIDRYNNDQPPYSQITFDTIKGENITYYQYITDLYQVVTEGGNTHTNILSRNLQNVAFTYPKTDDDSILQISICMVKVPHPYIKGAKALQLSVEKVRIMN